MVERERTPVERTRGSGWSAAEWLLGIFGAIAVFLGVFIMFAGEESSIGLGGDLTWRVGDVSDAWMYGLLIAGVVMLVGAVSMIVAGRNRPRVVSSPLKDLLVHAGIFAVVNAFIWIQDLVLGDGLDYALWVTVPWGIGLVIHLGTYVTTRGAYGAAAPAGTMPEEAEPKELQHR